MVWMEPSGMPIVKKLWARIEEDLVEGKYTLIVTSSEVYSDYDQDEFDGEKWVSLSTTTRFGGDQKFLSLLLLTNGAILLGFSLYFLLKGLRSK
jgi:hypothetical protein